MEPKKQEGLVSPPQRKLNATTFLSLYLFVFFCAWFNTFLLQNSFSKNQELSWGAHSLILTTRENCILQVFPQQSILSPSPNNAGEGLKCLSQLPHGNTKLEHFKFIFWLEVSKLCHEYKFLHQNYMREDL